MPIALLSLDLISFLTNPLVTALVAVIILIHANSQIGIQKPDEKKK